jgi:predicted nucleic acid-binding Zn ribbon protein
MSDPTRVGDVVARLVERDDWRERIAAGRLRARWPEIVGEAIASHSQPVRLAGGVLLVRTEAGAWATELTLLASTIARRADDHLGGGLVKELKVVAGR